jgi:hypothetical protein
MVLCALALPQASVELNDCKLFWEDTQFCWQTPQHIAPATI